MLSEKLHELFTSEEDRYRTRISNSHIAETLQTRRYYNLGSSLRCVISTFIHIPDEILTATMRHREVVHTREQTIQIL